MKKILVVVDMQKDFTTGPLGNSECCAAIKPVTELIGSGSYDLIIATRDTHTENYMNTQEGKKLPVPHCINGTDGWQLCSEVTDALEKAAAEVKYIDKPSFGSLELSTILKGFENSQDTVIDFCGVCTGICVISNAMIAKATLSEAVVSVVKGACACVSPDSHNTAIEAMKLCQIEIV